MSVCLGLDTSNYRTSCAYYGDGGDWENQGTLLPVPPGGLGLRQSEAVFHHIKALPERVQALGALDIGAVAASTRPRAVEGSYMPCFLVGETVGRSVSTLCGVPFYAFSHQQGHVAAAALSAGRLEWLRRPFYAWHVSGGTTELLLVEPDEEQLIRAQAVGGTNDLAAGQLIDRAGVLLGCRFPAGPQVEQLAQRCDAPDKPFAPKCRQGVFSLSGVENQLKRLHEKGAPPERIARYVLETVGRALIAATEQVMDKRPLPLLCAGGVMANRALAQQMRQRFDAAVAEPTLSGDNAVGVALLGRMRQEGWYGV